MSKLFQIGALMLFAGAGVSCQSERTSSEAKDLKLANKKLYVKNVLYSHVSENNVPVVSLRFCKANTAEAKLNRNCEERLPEVSMEMASYVKALEDAKVKKVNVDAILEEMLEDSKAAARTDADELYKASLLPFADVVDLNKPAFVSKVRGMTFVYLGNMTQEAAKIACEDMHGQLPYGMQTLAVEQDMFNSVFFQYVVRQEGSHYSGGKLLYWVMNDGILSSDENRVWNERVAADETHASMCVLHGVNIPTPSNQRTYDSVGAGAGVDFGSATQF